MLAREVRRLAWVEHAAAERAVRQHRSLSNTAAYLAEHLSDGRDGTFRFDVERRPRAHARLLGVLETLQAATLTRVRISVALRPLLDDESPFVTARGGLLLRGHARLPERTRARLEEHIDLLLLVSETEAFRAASEHAGTVDVRTQRTAGELWDWFVHDAASSYALLELAAESGTQARSIRTRLGQVLALRRIDLPVLAARSVSGALRGTGRGIAVVAAAVSRAIEEHGTQQAARAGRPVAPAIEVGVAHQGFMPRRLAEVVEQQPLNTSGLLVTLRGYQAFGARYTLAQRRVILGDEMGLGKTIVALAVMTHLVEEEGADHFLVVAPNSVLHNWAHEVAQRTRLSGHILHGSQIDRAVRDWQRTGGVAITTYGTLRNVPLSSENLPLLVVDEAHYVKNPNAQRTQEVAARITLSDRVLLMSGTPMENRLDEFRRLARLVSPGIQHQLPGLDAWSSEVFRASAAPLYLRRNQEDVLPELPELIEVEEWVSFTGDDMQRYEDALERSGNFIPLRYAAFPNQHRSGDSAKLSRLVELVTEAVDEGLKVAIYSEYHATLDAVCDALATAGLPTFGPITGAVAPGRRLAIIRDLTDHSGGAALISQIQAGGIGLNIQAASVVILCEPALKPSIEVQAIARSFRMGQTRVVRVHRLLSEEGIDQRIRDLLARKQAEFDTYVRHSAIAEASEAAVERALVDDLNAYRSEEAARLGIAV
jgi:superfamily II DNA or RNA helicase